MDVFTNQSCGRKLWYVVQLVAAEERCALAETEIRAEVSTEMASLLHDMEANYKVGFHTLQ